MIPAYLEYQRTHEQYTDFEETPTASTIPSIPHFLGNTHQVISRSCISGYTLNSAGMCEKNVSKTPVKTSTAVPSCSEGYFYNIETKKCELLTSAIQTPATANQAVSPVKTVSKGADNMNYTEFNDSTTPTTSIGKMVSPCQSGYSLNSQGVCVADGSSTTGGGSTTVGSMSAWTGIILILAIGVIAYLAMK